MRIPSRIQDVDLARGSNPEPLHAEQEKSHFAHDCALHWLHNHGNTFLLKASSWFYSILGQQDRGSTYCTYDILSWLSRYIQSIYSRTGCALIRSLCLVKISLFSPYLIPLLYPYLIRSINCAIVPRNREDKWFYDAVDFHVGHTHSQNKILRIGRAPIDVT